MTHSFLIVGGTKKKRKNVSGKLGKLSELERQNVREPDGSDSPEIRNTGTSDTLAHRDTDALSRSEFSEFDTTILEPEEDKQAISIDQVRNLQHQLSLKPYASDKKVGIILEAQRMTVEAQNALLKTLEEPPAHSILILTAPSTKNLLPTIASRCQVMRLRPKIDLDIESEEHRRAVEEFLTLLRSGRPARQRVAAGESGGGERLAWVEENKATVSSQQSAVGFLEVWISVLRDLLLVNSGCQALALNSFKPFTPFKPFDTSDLTKSLGLTIKTKNLIAKTNVSPRLALEVLLLDLPVL